MEVGLTDCLSRRRAESGNGKACDALHTSRFCTSNPSITDIRRYNLCGSALGRLDGDTGLSAGRGSTRTAAGRAQTGRFHDRDRRSARRRRAPDHRCRSARQCCEPHGGAAGRRGASRCRTSGRLGASGALSLASGRCDRRGRRDRVCGRRDRRGMGRFAAGARLLLVLHRSKPDPGFLGRLSITARVWSGRHDAAESGSQPRRPSVGR